MKVSHNQKVFLMEGIHSELSVIVHASTIFVVIHYFNIEVPTFSINVLNSSWSSIFCGTQFWNIVAYLIIFSFSQNCSSVIFHLNFALP
jgi:hypothetical protein